MFTIRPVGCGVLLVALLSHLGGFRLCAGDAGAQGVPAIAEREIAARAGLVEQAREAIAEGRQAEAAGRTGQALEMFSTAHQSLPRAPMTEAIRREAALAFAETGTREAARLAQEGNKDEAAALLDRVLDENMAPGHRPARVLRDRLGDAVRFTPARTPDHARRVGLVTEALLEAESLLLHGRYDDAGEAYDRALLWDPYNVAARHGQEDVERHRRRYFEQAHNHTRARMLRQVDELWETANPEIFNSRAAGVEENLGEEDEIEARNRALALERKMQRLVIPRVNIEGVTVREAVEYLVTQSRGLDTEVPPGQPRGVDMVVQLSEDDGPVAQQVLSKEISLKLDNVPLDAALGYVAQQAGLKVEVQSFAVVLLLPSQASTALFTKTYVVPPDFISSVPADAGAAGGDPFAMTEPGDGGFALERLTAQQFLEQAGVTFPEGAFVRFDARTSTLSMRNNLTNHKLVEDMIQLARGTLAPQVSIEARMMSVTQRNLEELGFDWLLGAFGITSGVLGAGGTGDLTVGGLAPFPLTNPVTGGPVGSNAVTASLRSGDQAISGNALEKLLDVVNTGDLAESRLPAPGALSLAGVLTEPNFQVMIRAINQQKGLDSLTAPVATTRSGLPAKVEIIREFIYPTEYDPPELPSDVGIQANDGAPAGFPVTPATPSAFDTKSLGTVMEVEPVVSADGTVVEVTIDLMHREFLGFVNYGSPITTASVDELGQPLSTVVTENRILQPIFETRQIKTTVSVYDGQTLVLGGLTGESVESVEDKIPLLGDAPLLGRFFKSRAEERTRTMFIIFLTVRTIDPGGNPLNEGLEN